MRNIIIVECKSTGVNFIEDIINRGYNPVVLEVSYSDSKKGDEYMELTHSDYNDIDYYFDMIYEQDTYEKTLEIVKKWDPLLILPGNEKGVVLATKLANDLNLLCNPIENLDAMTLKDKMQNKIAEKGLRSIKGKVVKSIEEAIEFYDNEELKEVIIKPTYSAGSYNVRSCQNKEEMINSLEELFTKTNLFGDEIHDLLIQERINGTEYIVNTVSCNGQHRVTLIWKYKKVKTSEGAMIYDTCETVNELNLGEAEMIEYAYDVADALGIQYGPVHGEYMIDEKGPVLIEVNCRPCGGHMPANFLDNISGQHETDSILDSYLKPEAFQEKLKKKYELYEYGALKFFSVSKDIIAKSSPIHNISIKLKSHFKTSVDNIDEEDKKTYFKTVDVDSSCGIIFLVHKNLAEVEHDLNYLRSIEKHAFSLILSEENEIKENTVINLDTVAELVEIGNKYGTGLFITDQNIKNNNILQVHPDNLKNIKGEFDYTIINLNETLIKNNTNILVKILLESFEKVKNGGLVFIPKTTYQLFSTGRKSMEALLIVLNFKIEVPPHGMKSIIIASKK